MSGKVSKADANRPVARDEMSKLAWTWKEMKRNKTAYFMLAPFLILFIIFTVLPVVLSMFLSLTDFNMLEMPGWQGIKNYTRLFLEDEIFMLACQNTLIFAAITGPVSYLLSLLVAWFVNELAPKVRAVVTLIFYAPSISGQVYLIWKTLFSSDSYGWANANLMKLGIITQPILWFEDANYVMGLCIVVALWTSLGTAFLSFIAGFQTVDRSMYEAAAVDGIKNRWQELWYITLPTMRPQMMFGAVLAITNSFGFGGVVTALCGFPSVGYAAHTIMHHLDDYGGQRYEIGYASAIAVVLFIIMYGANVIIKKALAKVGE
ncbi:MAG: sugar ABC transporter permease [Ruminococcaceae bacterium]|nr:sugar ABC transporter permease [Oscillospiraceae bacterium]